MISRKQILAVTGVIVVLSAIAAYLSWNSQRNDRIALAAAVRNRAALEKAIQRAIQRADATERQQKGRRVELADRETQNRPASKPKGGAPFNLGASVLNDPKFQALYFAMERPKLLLHYGALIQALGLTPEQTDKFVQNMIKRDETALDLAATARAQHLAPGDPSIGALSQQAADDYQAAQTALLGPSEYSQADAFERTAPIRDIVDSVAGQLALSGEPLTALQANQMVQAAANASDAFANGKSAGPGTVDWTAALTQVQAQGILSASQLAAYTTAVNNAKSMPKIIGLLSKAPASP
jgi:hypothetical protein